MENTISATHYNWQEIESFLQKTETLLLGMSPLEINRLTYPVRPRELRDAMDDANLDSEEYSYSIIYPNNSLYPQDNKPIIKKMITHLREGIAKNDFYHSHIHSLIASDYPDFFFPWLGFLSDIQDDATWMVLFNHCFSHHSPGYIFNQLSDTEIKKHILDILNCTYMKYPLSNSLGNFGNFFMEHLLMMIDKKFEWTTSQKMAIIEAFTVRVQDFYKDAKPGLGFHFNLNVDTILTISHLFELKEDRTAIIDRLIGLMKNEGKKNNLNHQNFANTSAFKTQTLVLEQEIDLNYLRYHHDIAPEHFSNMFSTLNSLLKNSFINKLGFDFIEFRSVHGHMAKKLLHAKLLTKNIENDSNENSGKNYSRLSQKEAYDKLEKLYVFLLSHYEHCYVTTIAEKKAKDSRHTNKNISIDSATMEQALHYFVMEQILPQNDESEEQTPVSGKLKI